MGPVDQHKKWRNEQGRENPLPRTWPRADTVNESSHYLVKERFVQDHKEDLRLEARTSTSQAVAVSYFRKGAEDAFQGFPPLEVSSSLSAPLLSSGVHQNYLCLLKHGLLGTTTRVTDSVYLVGAPRMSNRILGHPAAASGGVTIL